MRNISHCLCPKVLRLNMHLVLLAGGVVPDKPVSMGYANVEQYDVITIPQYTRVLYCDLFIQKSIQHSGEKEPKKHHTSHLNLSLSNTLQFRSCWRRRSLLYKQNFISLGFSCNLLFPFSLLFHLNESGENCIRFAAFTPKINPRSIWFTAAENFIAKNYTKYKHMMQWLEAVEF